MAIEQLHPEILDIEERLISVYRDARSYIDRQLEALTNNPLTSSLRQRLTDLRERVEFLMRHVDLQAAQWVNQQVPVIYAMGAADARVFGNAFTQVNTGAVNELALGTLQPLLEATSHVADDVKSLMTKVADDVALEKVIGLRDLAGAQARMTEIVENAGVSAAVYSDGTRMPIDSYSAMVIRTRTGVAYNTGTLDSTRGGGTEWVEVSDGPFCGLDGHEELPLADGLIMTIDEAMDHLLSHPNCRRAFLPRPDITDPETAKSIRDTGDESSPVPIPSETQSATPDTTAMARSEPALVAPSTMIGDLDPTVGGPAARARVAEAMSVGQAAIDSVHRALEGLVSEPVLARATTDPRVYGYTSIPGWDTDPNAAITEVAVRANGSWPELTYVHEFGHVFDWSDLGESAGWSSQSSAELDGWRAAVRETEAYKTLDGIRDARPGYVKVGGGEAWDPELRRHIDYLLSDHELFARSYAQWIAVESGDSVLLEQLRLSVSHNGDMPRQWESDDFANVVLALRRLFGTLGLL